MKKRLRTFTILLLIIIFILLIFIKSKYLKTITSFSINLFINNIFPSIFPMFIISYLLVEIDIPKILGNIFRKPFYYLFKSKKESSFVFFMSMLTGFPSSAKYIDDLIEKNVLTKEDGEKTLMFTFFSNPLFIVNTVGNTFLNSTYLGFIILICHFLGNILTGITFRNYNKSTLSCKINYNNLDYLNYKIEKCDLFNTLTKGIKSSLKVLINIFGIVTFTLIVVNLIFDKQNIITIVITGLLEITSGLKYLSIQDISVLAKALISMFFISFGGLSIHAQIFSIVKKRKIKYLPFLISRITHAIYSTICLIIFIFCGLLDTQF